MLISDKKMSESLPGTRVEPDYDVHVKINESNIQHILQMVVKHYSSGKNLSFQDLTSCLSISIEKTRPIRTLRRKLNEPQLKKKFKWMEFPEPANGIILFYKLKHNVSILVHISKLSKDNSELRIFCRNHQDSNLFPENALNFLYRIIDFYKRKTSKARLGSTMKFILSPSNDCKLSSFEYSAFLLHLFCSGIVSPQYFSKLVMLPSPSVWQFRDFCKEINQIISNDFQQGSNFAIKEANECDSVEQDSLSSCPPLREKDFLNFSYAIIKFLKVSLELQRRKSERLEIQIKDLKAQLQSLKQEQELFAQKR